MSRPEVYDLLFDEENEEKMASHGLTPAQVLQVLSNDHLVVRNRRTGAAPYLIIGTDNGGRCIAMPVVSTYDRYLWRPLTAWPCKESERRRLERG